jgi:hypothetical protein
MKEVIVLVTLAIAVVAGSATAVIMQTQAAGQHELSKRPGGIAATGLRICGAPGPHPSMGKLTC